ncbi:MAG: hypothetical protein M1824_006116 [Vezdaea acicularis]|nr:MAG: hypothetical protein M1824_006116 [Vezdaea acicularis]
MGDNARKSAYGTPASDTSFRKTWDKDEYAQKAAVRESKEKEESKARYEAKLAGKKYIPRASTPPDTRETTARSQRLDVSSFVGKTSLVPAGSAMGKRGKGAGFWCEDCDLTFKDNLQWVEHLNSKQHLVATGQTGEVRRATVEEVKERLRWLSEKKKEEQKGEVVELGERLKVRAEEDEKEKEARRERRREQRRSKREGSEEHKFKAEEEGEDEMAKMMGFGGFGSTKV